MSTSATSAAEIESTGDDSPARGLFRFVWRLSGKRQFFAIGLAAIVAALSVVPLELKRIIIDEAIESKDAYRLALFGGMFVGAVLLQGLLKFAQRVYMGWLSESAIRYCRRHLAELRDEAGQHGEEGEAISIMSGEIDQVGGFVGDGLAEPVAQGGVLVAIAAYMLTVDPLVAAVALGFLVPQVVLAPLIQRRINRLVKRRIGMLRELTGQIAEGREERIADDEYLANLDSIYRNRMAFYCWKFLGKALLNFMNWLGPIAALLFGGWMVIQGRTELGVVVAFMSGMERMSGPLRDLLAWYRRMAQTRVKHDMIASWMPRRSRGRGTARSG